MSEKQKMLSGLMYNSMDDELIKERLNCKKLCFEFNNLSPEMADQKKRIIKKIFKKTGKNFLIEQNFYCDYGYNITIGENFYSNHNLIILDCTTVEFGDNVLIGPNCSFYAPEHPVDFKTRNSSLEFAKPIKIGNNVWIGGSVVVLGGVTIGDNCVIGAGSVVVKDIPANSIAVGNPCKVIKKIC